MLVVAAGALLATPVDTTIEDGAIANRSGAPQAARISINRQLAQTYEERAEQVFDPYTSIACLFTEGDCLIDAAANYFVPNPGPLRLPRRSAASSWLV
jgi:hypothetical protein